MKVWYVTRLVPTLTSLSAELHRLILDGLAAADPLEASEEGLRLLTASSRWSVMDVGLIEHTVLLWTGKHRALMQQDDEKRSYLSAVPSYLSPSRCSGWCWSCRCTAGRRKHVTCSCGTERSACWWWCGSDGAPPLYSCPYLCTDTET